MVHVQRAEEGPQQRGGCHASPLSAARGRGACKEQEPAASLNGLLQFVRGREAMSGRLHAGCSSER